MVRSLLNCDCRDILSLLGMAKASADCVGEAHGGFAADGSDISGFSHMVSSTSFNCE
jgi:hypothetical protein